MDYLQAARDLGPLLDSEAAQIERDGRLTPAVVRSFIDAGLFRMLAPRNYGGGELDLPIYDLVIEEIAKHDGSAAWCLSQSASTGMTAAYLDEKTGYALTGNRDDVLAHSHGPGCQAVSVDGGYRVSGRWTYGTTSHHSTWLGGDAMIMGTDGNPELLPNGRRRMVTAYFPAKDAAIVDSWNVSGLRGTGSDTFVAEHLFVPNERVLPMPRGDALLPGPLYACPMRWGYASGFASVALGLARAMLDAYEDLASNKTARVAVRVLRESGVVQADAGRMEARLRSARALLRETMLSVWDEIERTPVATLDQRVRVRLATTHAIQECSLVADAVHRAAGGNAIQRDGAFDRRFRDMHAVTQHVQGNQVHYEATGQYYLGLEPDETWL